MAATKRNPGLTSAVPRASLNDEELVSVFWQLLAGRSCLIYGKLIVFFSLFHSSSSSHENAENARLQENVTSAHLPDLQHHSAQLPTVDGHLADLLL